MDIPFLQLDATLPVPSYARPGDAGADLIAREDVTLSPSGGRAVIPTGFSVALPEGFAGFVLPRSGLAAWHGVTCLNAPGLIDSGYRGEIAVVLVNTDPHVPFEVHRGDRIAQFVVIECQSAHFVAVDTLPASARGAGGFGHTGV